MIELALLSPADQKVAQTRKSLVQAEIQQVRTHMENLGDGPAADKSRQRMEQHLTRLQKQMTKMESSGE